MASFPGLDTLRGSEYTFYVTESRRVNAVTVKRGLLAEAHEIVRRIEAHWFINVMFFAIDSDRGANRLENSCDFPS